MNETMNTSNENTAILTFLFSGTLSFLGTAVKEFADQEEIPSEILSIEDGEVKKIDHLSPFVIVAADVLLTNPKSRVLLYDTCIEKGSRLVLVGEQEDMDELLKVTAPALIAEKFYRPVNAREIVNHLKQLIEDLEEQGHRKRIMVVDDSPTFLRTAMEWLSEEYNVSVCPSAFAAIKMIATQQPNLILLDYEMPVCTGAQFLEMLNHEYDEKIPVIFLTSKSDAGTVGEVMALRPQGYLLKTQPKEAILKSIRDYFDKEKAR